MHWFWISLQIFPFLSAFFAWFVISTCISMAKYHTHIPVWLDFPPISLSGIHEPESAIYTIGFILIALQLSLLEYIYTYAYTLCLRTNMAIQTSKNILSSSASSTTSTTSIQNTEQISLLNSILEDAKNANLWKATSKISTWIMKSLLDLDKTQLIEITRIAEEFSHAQFIARIGFACLALQGIVPLQGWGETASLIHVMGANIFFCTSLYHAYKMLTFFASTKAIDLPLSRKRTPFIWLLKTICVVLALIPSLPAMILHPGSTVVDTTGAMPLDEELKLENAGFSQWWMVSSIVMYYVCFAFDFSWLAHEFSTQAKVFHSLNNIDTTTTKPIKTE